MYMYMKTGAGRTASGRTAARRAAAAMLACTSRAKPCLSYVCCILALTVLCELP